MSGDGLTPRPGGGLGPRTDRLAGRVRADLAPEATIYCFHCRSFGRPVAFQPGKEVCGGCQDFPFVRLEGLPAEERAALPGYAIDEHVHVIEGLPPLIGGCGCHRVMFLARGGGVWLGPPCGCAPSGSTGPSSPVPPP